MDKNAKKSLLIVTIIISLAIVFIPIYFYVLADSNDDNKFTVTNKKIIGIVDGTSDYDNNDEVGNDSSNHNNRVRTFDSIRYTVAYTLTEKEAGSTSGNVEGRNILVEVLMPTTYEATLRYGQSSINMYGENDNNVNKTVLEFNNVKYYYASFNVSASTLGDNSSFDFTLENINSIDINNYNSIKPLIFIKESTDTETPSINGASSLPNDITCELSVNSVNPQTGETTTTTSNVCGVTITGKEDYFVNLYTGSKKTDSREIPIGLIIGLRDQEGKGIKGLIVPKTLSFNITNSDSNNLQFNENSFKPYKTHIDNTDYRIDINDNNYEMPEINNGDITGTINQDGTVTINISDIKDYLITKYSDQFYYFSTDYFLTTVSERSDYSDVTITLTANKNNSNNTASSVQIVDSYNYVLGNYSSNIDIYSSSIISGEQDTPLEYGKANINYGSDFTIKTTFDYSSLSNSTGDGLTSLTNYVKVDNDVFKLINHKTTNKGYDFSSGEVTSVPSIKIDTFNGENSHEKVLFGFGEWNSNYFDIADNAPSNCPSNITSLTKEELMNLYGGPCIKEKDTIKWAYSPMAENDIGGNPITSNKGPLIVKSTYVSNSNGYINPGSSGTFELYSTIVDDTSIANSTHQIVTSGTAYGKNNTDFRYLGNETHSGGELLKNKNNFIKTDYDFVTRKVNSLNTNLCNDTRCPVSGATILISGIKVNKPSISSYKATDLTIPETRFYYYPIALKIDANASKSDDELRFDTIYVDVYLPDYMIVDDNYGASNEKKPISIEDTSLSDIRSKLNKEAPESDINYEIYHYVLTTESDGLNEEEKNNLQRGILSNFIIYSDIDLVTTPNASEPEIYAVVDFKATKHIVQTDSVNTIEFTSITSESDRSNSLEDVILYNSSAVTTKGSLTPNNIEKNGSYDYTMTAFNHSKGIVTGGYTYPTADLYYILPYNGDLASSDISSKIGTTKFTVSFDEESIGDISNGNDYKFYYATTGVPSNILSDEIKVNSDPSSIWHLWDDPTEEVSNVIAIKVVKQSPFEPNTYFASSNGLKVHVKALGSSEGNIFYNSFHILAKKPDNFSCTDTSEDENYCSETKQIKANYISSSSKTSVYERIISGFVFEDYDYNGIYTEEESKLKDIPVSLYKIETIPENYDSTDPTTFVKETDTLISTTVTGENGNYYFGGLSSGNYYVSYTIDNNKYIVTDLEKEDENINDSSSNNSSASLLPNTNKAISKIITFPSDYTGGSLIKNNINLGLAIKKEMAISLNKYITEVTVSKNGKVNTYDYSNQNSTQVSITVLNPKDTKVRVKYSFSIENTKYFPGYVGLIVDQMPTGMTFNPNLKENQYWVMYDNLLYYNGLSGKLLLPNEKQYFTLVLDLDLKEAGTYRNIVSARDLTLMGDELPVYDFSGINNVQGGE